MRQHGHLHIVEHGQTREDVGTLEGAPHPQLADLIGGQSRNLTVVKENPPLGGF